MDGNIVRNKILIVKNMKKKKIKERQKLLNIQDTPKKILKQLAEKSFIPNVKSLENKIDPEKSMRDFLENLNEYDEFTDFTDFDDKYVYNAYKLAEKEVNMSRESWEALSLLSKLKWILDSNNGHEFNKKNFKYFTNRLIYIFDNVEDLRNFILEFLDSDSSYKNFIDYYIERQAITVKPVPLFKNEGLSVPVYTEKDNLNNIELDNVYERMDMDYDEKEAVDRLQSELESYEKSLRKLEKNKIKTSVLLSDKNEDELFYRILPILRKKTLEELKKRVSNTRTLQDGTIETLNFEETAFKYSKYMGRDEIIKTIVKEESLKEETKIKDKIFKLTLDIRNSTGKLIPMLERIEILTIYENNYKKTLLVKIRKLELESKGLDSLKVTASALGVSSGTNHSKILNSILLKEFGEDYSKIEPLVSTTQMRNVLRTLKEKELNSLASNFGIIHPENNGKYANVQYILNKSFRKPKGLQTKSLIEGRNTQNWNYRERRRELEDSNLSEIKRIAIVSGLNISEEMNENDIINKILIREESVSKVIFEENVDKNSFLKNELSKITGAPTYSYNTWSNKDIKSSIVSLKSEDGKKYWIEMEQERLFSILSAIVDIKNGKYMGAKSWSIEKLRLTLDRDAGEEWNTYTPLVSSIPFNRCINRYSLPMWIKGTVTKVWLTNPTSKQYTFNDYVIKKSFIEEKGLVWYEANKRYFSLQCNAYKDKRSQKGEILTCYTQLNKKIEFMVAYTIIGYQSEDTITTIVDNKERTFIIQNEELFEKEKAYILSKLSIESDSVSNILSEIVSKKTLKNVEKTISKALIEIAPMKIDYGVIKMVESYVMGEKILSKIVESDTPYIRILMETLHDNQEQTNKELFTKAAHLLVFLKIEEAKTFRKNIEREYYLPDILASLSNSEKFPEAFEDPSVSDKFINDLMTTIDSKIINLVDFMAQMEFNIRNPSSRRRNLHREDFSRSISTNKRVSACLNKERVDGVSDRDIIYYKDGDKIFCFTIDELHEQIIVNDNTRNPETGLLFDSVFIKRFVEVYNKKLSDDGFLTEYFQKKYGFDNVLKEQNKVLSTQNKKRKRVYIDLDKIVRKDVEEMEEYLIKENDAKVDTRVNNKDVKKEDICSYCEKHVNKNSIKSTVLIDGEPAIINFCSLECFDYKKDWEDDGEDEKEEEKEGESESEEKDEKEEQELTKEQKKELKKKRKEIRAEKRLEKKSRKNRMREFDRMSIPLMTVSEIKSFVDEKNIKVSVSGSKKDITDRILLKLYPEEEKEDEEDEEKEEK
jgi:hypothetical protein